MPLIQREAPYLHWEFSDPSSGDLLRVVPERGGLISGWRCGDREVVYLDLERFLDPAQSVRGGFPVLFPITGGLPNNQLPLPQGTFTIGQHGFARSLPWQMEPLADERGVSINEIVLAYLLCQPHQTVPIFGGSSPDQVRDSVKAASLQLSTADLARLAGA